MSEVSLPAPKNKVLSVVNTIIDILVKGLGENAAIAYGQAQIPWLNWPVVSTIFKFLVSEVAEKIDTSLKQNVDVIIIRFQGDGKNEDYKKAIEPVKKPGVTNEQVEAAKRAIDDLVRRNRQ